METTGGLLVTVGLMTRLAAVPTAVIMRVALMTTKLPVLLGQDSGAAARSRRLASALRSSCGG